MTTQSLLNTTIGIIGTLLVQTTATPISVSSFYNQISTSTNIANAILLPPNPYIGQQYVFRNDGAFYCQVYPQVGGQINSLVVNAAYLLPAVGQITPIAITTSKWFVFSQNNVQLIYPLAVTGTLTAAQSGGIIELSHAAATVVTLPDVAASVGITYNFIIINAAANTVTIRATTACQRSVLIVETQAGVESISVVCLDRTDVIFTASAPAGSHYNIISDGTNWIGRGVSTIAVGFTTA